jgi:hypothetical protein
VRIRYRFALLAALVLVLVLPPMAASAADTQRTPPPKWMTPEIQERISAAPNGVHVSTIRDWVRSGLAGRDAQGEPVMICANGDPRPQRSVKAGACQVAPYGCTANFVFHRGTELFTGTSDGRNYFIGTAGHCVDHSNQPVFMETQNNVVEQIGTVAKHLEGGIGQNGRGNGGLGNDYAIVRIKAGLQVDPDMPAAVGGGPNGIYTGCTPQTVKYWGHGFALAVGPGKVSGGEAFTWYDRSFGFTGPALPGDSGSGVMTASGLAAGDLTHLLIGFDPRYFPSNVIGTRVTRALTWMGGNYHLVKADRTYERKTMADTTCGNANKGNPG